jgi:uncharacterized protein (TIGR03437 family)
MKFRILLLLLAGLAVVALTALAAETHTGWWHGRKIVYKVVNGKAIWQGDMVLPIQDISIGPPLAVAARAGVQKHATFIGDPSYLWPNGTVPYTIGAGVPAALRQFITNAIQSYASNTPIRWIPRTSEADYVIFKSEPASTNECGDSYVGKIGGAQSINLNVDTTSCTVDETIHEMGHAIGFEHEMTRGNRNFYVNVRYENIDKNEWSQFDQDLSQVDLLPYEYASIMHYGADDFQRNDFNTIDTIPLGISISHGHGLSPGDIEAVKTIYGQPSTNTVVSSNPPGLQVLVDGAAVITPKPFNWAVGSQHTLNVAAAPQAGAAGVRYAFARWSNDGPQSQTVVASQTNRILTANFAQQYHIQTSVGVGGGGTVSIVPASSDGFYTQGTLVTVTASPNAGFGFVAWAGTLADLTADSANPTTFTVNTANLQYTANFARAPITTIGSNFSNLSAMVDGHIAYLPSSFSWTPGSTHTIAIKDAVQPTGSTGLPYQYVFLNWSNAGAASQTITAAAASTTITAMWKKQFLVSTNINYPDPNGSNGGTLTVSPQSSSCSDATDCYYDQGATVTINARPSSPYAFGGWEGDLSGANPSGVVQVNDQIVVTANFQIPDTLNPAGITSGANYVYGNLAPGEIIDIFGLQFGPASLTTYQIVGGVMTNMLAQTRVLFDGVAAPLIYVSADLISAIVPYEVAGKQQTVIQIEYQGKRTNGVTFPVDLAFPALLTSDSSGGGQGAILNQNGSINSKSNPATRGSIVSLFGTGEGMTTPAGVDGRIAATTFPAPQLPVTVTIAGRNAQVQYFGAAPENVAGVIQINAYIPADCPSGNVPVAFAVGPYASPENVTVAVQ